MKKTEKTISCLAGALLIFAVAAAVCLKILTLPVSSSEKAFEQRVEVPSGTSAKKIAAVLKEDGLIRSQTAFYLCARYSALRAVFAGSAALFSLKSGVYILSSDMSLARIFEILSSGQQEFIRVVIPEGLTVSKIALRLESAGVCSAKDFTDSCRNAALLAEFQIAAESFEGYLFPDTYFFTPAMNAESVVSIMAETFFEKIKNIPGFSAFSPQQLNDTVILASIIEREYRLDEEAPLIASVFKNRLAHNIGLYSCATIEYILTEIEGREHPDVITYNDITIDSPYNTYKWAGLPPGAISNPGEVALNAAAHPAETDYYYFRITDAEKGKHVFSRTFSTHINEGYVSGTKKIGK